MSELLRKESPAPADDRYDIVAEAAMADDRTLVLKHGETFAVYDRHGDVVASGLGEQGLYHQGTRFLSRYVLACGPERPMLLGSTVLETNDVLSVDLTNPDLANGGSHAVLVHHGEETESRLLPHGALHLARSRFLWRGAAFERIEISNHGIHAAEVPLRFEFAADFADIFEVRGMHRSERGRRLDSEVGSDRVVLGYEGLDGVVRRTEICLSPAPEALDDVSACVRVRLAPGEQQRIDLVVRCQIGVEPVTTAGFDEAITNSERELASMQVGMCRITTSNAQFNAWLSRSVADLLMLITDTAEGPYPYAGVPWYSTVFGRDGILTALEWLWAHPPTARGVLELLAATQATEVDPERDAEPGKIVHERRLGEMAALGEIPFGRYYGTIDATPLFVVLAGAYHQRTDDSGFLRRLWPHVEAALEWIERYGDRDGDGFVEYARRSERGLANQGWKDSWDSVSHGDGRLATGPIALAEVQGYVYAAYVAGAQIAASLCYPERAAELRARALELRERFDERFWIDEIGCYAMALDGTKEPCRVSSSNAGHCLYSGIAKPARVRRVADTLLSPAMFSGWGVRTLSARARRYNPMAYHNGSVWPHDNAFVAAGLAAYGFKHECERITKALFDASIYVDLNRLPELFCGFPRRGAAGPVLYPVACAPQAWAAGASFLLVQSMLGLSIDAACRRVSLRWPSLPPFLDFVELENLDVGGSRVHLRLERHPGDVSVRVLDRDEEVEILVVK